MALVLTAPLLLSGCGDDGPGKLIDPPIVVAPDRSTPKNTLLRMNFAVEHRDSVITESVYADDYQGSSIDLTDPIAATLQFTRSDEVRAVGAMATSSSIIQISMDLYSPTGWFQSHDAADPPGWVTIQIPSFNIYINDLNGGEYLARAPSNGVTQVFEYTLKPTTPDSSSPTDTTWTIVRWTESRASL
jgi:hypothetical protein